MSEAARRLIEDADNTLLFSVASLREIAIKLGLGRQDFEVDPRLLRRALLDNGYVVTADERVSEYPGPVRKV
ncbi:type II toxin-antitoxin system VapC family toxin [Pigmentiphaga soli]|uniref:Type II toxin-antitoxin system VapC family toxin n=1 Tax=Pigmentiphaga soli TaxID=1007095 RepID=A0ABP8GTQ6_9BURK